MSKRMTSETIIFDTEWLTEADFDEGYITVSIDYQAYDTLKIIVYSDEILVFKRGGPFQEFDVYKLENFGYDYQILLEEDYELFFINHLKSGDKFELIFHLNKEFWRNNFDGCGLIYIKGVKR